MNDITFNSTGILSGGDHARLSNGRIYIEGATIGSFSIEDGDGKLILAPQREMEGEIEIDLSTFTIDSSIWKIRFPRGEAGTNITGGISYSQAIMLALLFE